MSFSAHTRLRRPVGHLVHKREGHGEVLCEENGVAAPMMPSILLMGGWQELDDLDRCGTRAPLAAAALAYPDRPSAGRRIADGMAGYAGYLSGITLSCVVARPSRWQSNAFYMNGEADLPFDCRFWKASRRP